MSSAIAIKEERGKITTYMAVIPTGMESSYRIECEPRIEFSRSIFEMFVAWTRGEATNEEKKTVKFTALLLLSGILVSVVGITIG